ncbi:MAG TPA: hypothetical protein VKA38_12275 [Draconibacterium sp.]|nr:hypothetical protein [Draconibacterium sp.]
MNQANHISFYTRNIQLASPVVMSQIGYLVGLGSAGFMFYVRFKHNLSKKV